MHNAVIRSVALSVYRIYLRLTFHFNVDDNAH